MSVATHDAVAGQELLVLVDAGAEGGRPFEDVLEQAVRQVEGDAARSDVGGVHPRSRDALIAVRVVIDDLTRAKQARAQLHELLPLFEAEQEGRESADV